MRADMNLQSAEKILQSAEKIGTIVGKLIILARVDHYVCDDPYYNCPMHPEGNNWAEEKKCRCGADEHNAKVDALAVELLEKLLK
jgi:hypothetical protein